MHSSGAWLSFALGHTSFVFEDSTITSVSDFLQQDAGQLAPFLRVCHDHCAELEGYGSSRV